MSTEGIFDALKSLGAIVALPTSAFVIYDRLIRNRPFLSIRAAEHRQGTLELCIHNLADEALLVEGPVVTPDLFVAAFGQDLTSSLRAAATRQYGDRRSAIVESKQAASMPLIPADEIEKAEDSTKVTFYVRWHPTSSRLYWRRGLKISRTIGELRKIEHAVALSTAKHDPIDNN